MSPASALNFWAVLAAAVSAFLVGGLWYSPVLFGRAWQRANGFSDNPAPAGAGIFIAAFIISLVMAINLAFFLNAPGTTPAWGATAGFLAGFGWAAMGIGIVDPAMLEELAENPRMPSVFERRTWRYMLINGGYLTIALTLMGAILGAWR